MRDELTRISIRQIFLSPRPHVAYITAADRLGISFLELKAEIAEGTIVAVSTGWGMRVSKEEMIAAAMRTWPQAVIEEGGFTRRRGGAEKGSSAISAAPRDIVPFTISP